MMKTTRTSQLLPWERLFQRSAPELTDKQKVFIVTKTRFPWPSSAKAARIAGYSDSVARKADRIIVRGSRLVSRILQKYRQDSDRAWEQEGRVIGEREI